MIMNHLKTGFYFLLGMSQGPCFPNKDNTFGVLMMILFHNNWQIVQMMAYNENETCTYKFSHTVNIKKLFNYIKIAIT